MTLRRFVTPRKNTSEADFFFFLINYAIGGISGWQIDFARYGNQGDMRVDYMRVYSVLIPLQGG